MKNHVSFLSVIFLLLFTTIESVDAQTIGDVIKPKVERELALEENKIPGSAVILVYSNTNWSGNVAHGDGSSSTKDSFGDAKFVARCADLAFVQGLFQKQTEDGWLAVVIIQDGKIIGSESTNAQFGIAHATGNCISGVGGGCLIATATFGSELAPQVQFLREIRDNTVLSTASGTSFMTAFNAFYYSFSPTVADWERQNPAFKEIVKVAIAPLLSSLSLLQYVDIDSEAEMLGYGIGIILLNVGMYFVAPAFLIVRLKSRFSRLLYWKRKRV